MPKNYPKIGETIKFVRHDVERDEIVQGEGVVQAIVLDPDKRVVVHVRAEQGEVDGDEAQTLDGFVYYTIEFACINPNEKMVEAFTKMVRDVKLMSEQANEKIQAIVEEDNAKIDAIRSKVLGDKLEI